MSPSCGSCEKDLLLLPLLLFSWLGFPEAAASKAAGPPLCFLSQRSSEHGPLEGDLRKVTPLDRGEARFLFSLAVGGEREELH